MERLLPRFTAGVGLLVMLMVGLTACSNLPGPRPAAQSTATATPSRAGRREREERSGPATAVAGPGPATAVALVGCDAYAAWMSDPGIEAALKNIDLWPEIVAAGEAAAGGGTVDRARLKQIDDQIARAAGNIRGSEAAGGDQQLTQLASRAMGLAARLTEGLADGSIDQKAAGDDVARLKEAIGAYETEAAAQKAQCG